MNTTLPVFLVRDALKHALPILLTKPRNKVNEAALGASKCLAQAWRSRHLHPSAYNVQEGAGLQGMLGVAGAWCKKSK